MSAVIVSTAINSAITLCMLGIVFRWTAPYLEVDIHRGTFRWLPRVTDPYIHLVRRVLPPAGPMDLAPVASVVVLWILRVIVTGA